MTVKLNTISDIKNFIRKVVQCKGDVFALCGSYRVDAKSLMGLLSLDLEQPITLEISDTNSSVFEELKPWAV